MKIQDKFLSLALVTTSFVLTVIPVSSALAQEATTTTTVMAVHQESNRRIELIVGQTVAYKTKATAAFTTGRITAITDSTMSFENKKNGIVTVRYKDLAGLKVRNHDKRFAGTTLIILGAATFLVGVFAEGISESSIGSGGHDPGAIAAITGGAIGAAAGILLTRPMKINLTKSWKLSSGKGPAGPAISDIVAKEESKAFYIRLGAGGGTTLTGNGAYLLSFEPSYRVHRNFVMGLKIEGLLASDPEGNLKGGTFTVNGQYYLGKNKVRPFVGAGLGVCAFGDPEFGFYPRVGIEAGQFSLTVDYTLIPVSSPAPSYVGPTSSQITGQPVIYYAPTSSPVTDQITKYLGVRIGYNLGGSRK